MIASSAALDQRSGCQTSCHRDGLEIVMVILLYLRFLHYLLSFWQH